MSLRYMTFNDRQDVMKGQSRHVFIPQPHDVTQHQSSGSFILLSLDVEGLQLTQTQLDFILKHKLQHHFSAV